MAKVGAAINATFSFKIRYLFDGYERLRFLEVVSEQLGCECYSTSEVISLKFNIELSVR